MLKITTTLFIGLFSAFQLLSQEAAEQNPVKENMEFTHVSSNRLGTAVTVHTYKLLSEEMSTVSGSDLIPQTPSSPELQAVIDKVLAVEGVSECSFDGATNTLTIVSTPVTDLSSIFGSRK